MIIIVDKSKLHLAKKKKDVVPEASILKECCTEYDYDYQMITSLSIGDLIRLRMNKHTAYYKIDLKFYDDEADHLYIYVSEMKG
jgi:hypothetical protein